MTMTFFSKTLIQNILVFVMAMIMAWGLKYHYSIASADDLKWVLKPTALLVEIAGNMGAGNSRFVFEPHTGYVDFEQRIIIAPACAGVNFLIAAFCLGLFSGVFRMSGWYSKLSWLSGCAFSAFLATICVNAVRIIISIAMISSNIHAGWFTPQRLHRMTGILIYFFFLMMFYLIIQKIIRNRSNCNAHKKSETAIPMDAKYRTARAVAAGLFPLVCYWMMAIIVPLANHAVEKNPAGFTEHCVMVIIGSSFIFMLLFSLRPILNNLKFRFFH